MRSASGPARRPTPLKKPTPWYVWAGLVAASIAVVFLVWNLVAPKEEAKVEAPVEKKVDNTSKVKTLEKQIPALRAEYKAVQQDMSDEKPSAKQRAEALKKKLRTWMEEWDAFFETLTGPDGKIPPEYGGYRKSRSDVNQIMSDLIKNSGF
jgi:hypothetical protein